MFSRKRKKEEEIEMVPLGFDLMGKYLACSIILENCGESVNYGNLAHMTDMVDAMTRGIVRAGEIEADKRKES